MEIFQKKIPKEFLESLPEGMRLVRGNNKNFLVVEKLLYPNGCSLNRIIACAKRGCSGHGMKITELPGSVAAAVSNINFYVENFDNNDFFMGV